MSSNNMQVVLNDAIPGMVLADDLLDSHRQVLLPQNTVLTVAMLQSLARHGIPTLSVLTEEISAADASIDLAQQEARLSILFRKLKPSADTVGVGDATDATWLLQQLITKFRLGAST
ncbi:MAG: hypothetical protein V4805_16600 [Pseudomonadota bacterium]